MESRQCIEDLERARRSLKKSKVMLEMLISFFNARGDAEMDSATRIEAVASESKCLAVTEDDSGIARSIRAMQISLLKRSRQSRQFHEDVKSEVIAPLLIAQKRHDLVWVPAERDSVTLSKSVTTARKAHDEALAKFDKTTKNANAYILDHQVNLNASPNVRSRLASKAGLTAFDAGKAEIEYQKAAGRLNEVSRKFEEEMEPILNQLTDIQRERLEGMKESIEKFFIFEIAVNRNNQYDNERSFLELQHLNDAVLTEIETLQTTTHRKNSGHSFSLDVKIVSYEEILNSSTLPSPQSRVQSPRAQPTSPMIREIQSVERKVVEAIWTQGSAELTPDVIEAMNEPFTTSVGRISFCRAVAAQPAELPSLVALRNLGRVLAIALDQCESELDSDSARRIAAFAQIFYTSETGRKKYLQAEIYHHALWNRVQFWEDALSLVIFDELVLHHLSYSQADIDLIIYQSGITPDTFGNHILVFGINPTSAVEIAKRVVAKHFPDKQLQASLTERILAGIRSAQERQVRHVAQLKSRPETRPESPNILL